MCQIKLDYLKDTEGNYILRQEQYGELIDNYIESAGNYSEIFIFNKNNFDKKLKHKLEDIASAIRKHTMREYKVTHKDILSEKMILNIIPEEKFNPLFETMTENEIKEYTKNSRKIKISINFNYCLKLKQHLWFKSMIGLLKKNTNNQ